MNGMAAAIAILRDAYPRQDFPDRTVAVYATALADLGDEEVMRAVERLIRRSTWLPSIAEIRLDVAEERLGLPSVEDAWAMVRAGAGGAWPAPVRDAADDVGGSWAVRTTGHPEILYAQFRRSYDARRRETVEGEIGALAAPTAPVSLGVVRARAIPESARIRPRPIMGRVLTRMTGRLPGPPTEDEKRDAIAVLRDGPEGDIEFDLLYREAERTFADATSEG